MMALCAIFVIETLNLLTEYMDTVLCSRESICEVMMSCEIVVKVLYFYKRKNVSEFEPNTVHTGRTLCATQRSAQLAM